MSLALNVYLSTIIIEQQCTFKNSFIICIGFKKPHFLWGSDFEMEGLEYGKVPDLDSIVSDSPSWAGVT